MATPQQPLLRPNSASNSPSSLYNPTKVTSTVQSTAKSLGLTTTLGLNTERPLVLHPTHPLLTSAEGQPRKKSAMPTSSELDGSPPISTSSRPQDQGSSMSTRSTSYLSNDPADQSVTNPATKNNSEDTIPNSSSSLNTEDKSIHAGPGPLPTILDDPSNEINIMPVIIGIYGISGSGKSYLISQLKAILGEKHFNFYDGSGMIDKVAPGGLSAFKEMPASGKAEYRNLAIRRIQQECIAGGAVGVVAGHYMFWTQGGEDETTGKGDCVWTTGDSETFTHMLYLDVPTDIVLKQCREDELRTRAELPKLDLEAWQLQERTELKTTCSENGILFSVLARNDQLVETAARLLRDFSEHTEALNLVCAQDVLDEIIAKGDPRLETMLVMDGDRTLCAVDTGEMFWAELGITEDPLKKLFSGPMKYSHNAFRQASLLYDEATDSAKYISTCRAVASKVKIHPEFIRLLSRAEHYSHIDAVVVTCGLRLVWEMVLKEAGLPNIKVIGSGRINNGYVVTAEVKADLVKRLRDKHNMYTWAFGDSPLDLPMLKEADEAVVVVGYVGKRSKTMDKELDNALANGGLVARQALLPSVASPRLTTEKLPIFDLRNHAVLESILRRREPLTVLHASTSATQLLQTPMRSATNSGASLQAIHKKVGWFLATELVTEAVGTEEYYIPHVQGGLTIGYRLLHEQNTTIFALMRGGEPMARGVNEAFPLAMFVHANRSSDLKAEHLNGQKTILLVDSVINNGTTIVDFMKRVKALGSAAKIVVVTGVAQKKSIAEDGPLARVGREGFTVVALRLSDNKYTGRGETDTGNRLFNTTRFE